MITLIRLIRLGKNKKKSKFYSLSVLNDKFQICGTAHETVWQTESLRWAASLNLCRGNDEDIIKGYFLRQKKKKNSLPSNCRQIDEVLL